MYIAIAILATIFAVNAPAKIEKAAATPATPMQAAPAAPKETPVLIDSRFSRKGKVRPWEKSEDPAEFIPSARTC